MASNLVARLGGVANSWRSSGALSSTLKGWSWSVFRFFGAGSWGAATDAPFFKSSKKCFSRWAVLHNGEQLRGARSMLAPSPDCQLHPVSSEVDGVVAVVGGLAYYLLEHAGHLYTPLSPPQTTQRRISPLATRGGLRRIFTISGVFNISPCSGL